VNSRRLISAIAGSGLHAAFPKTTLLATMRGGHERRTLRSPLTATLLPVALLIRRAIGSCKPVQSTSMTSSTNRARKTPAVHLSERVRVIAVQEEMWVMFPGEASSKAWPGATSARQMQPTKLPGMAGRPSGGSAGSSPRQGSGHLQAMPVPARSVKAAGAEETAAAGEMLGNDARKCPTADCQYSGDSITTPSAVASRTACLQRRWAV
jgi:hypothetical protein